jgi:hypothetical protein
LDEVARLGRKNFLVLGWLSLIFSHTPLMNDTIQKGTVVRYKTGWMKVTAKFKNSVNLGPIFGSKTTIKKVQLFEVFPDHQNWYNRWSESETYKCM